MSEVAELIERLRSRIDGTGLWRTAGPDEDMQEMETAFTARVAELERERDEARSSVAAIADYVEPHWRGAGLALDHEWILRRLQLSSERREDAEDRADATEARLAKAVEVLRLARNRLNRAAVAQQSNSSMFYELSEWADEATAALAELEEK